jgi:hypothetical protein
VVAVGAAVAVVVYFLLVSSDAAPVPEPTWAERLTERLGREGRARGRARQPWETVIGYSAALTVEVLPDPRVAEVGRLLSGSLFGRTPAPPTQQSWAERVVEEVTDRHPAPKLGGRSGKGRPDQR